MEIDIASIGRAFLFLGVPFILMVFYFQYRWAKVCEQNIQVLVAEKGGGGKYQLAPKDGGEVTIHNPDTGDIRTWPVNELATIDITYPGVGFVPKFLQKSIRLAIVNEGDWEPMLNRSPHRLKVASPDVVQFIQQLAEENPRLKQPIDSFLKGVTTGTTREMIADPSTLGNLMRSGVLKSLASVSNDLLEQLKSINTRLSRIVGASPMITYVLLGLIAILMIYTVFQIGKITPALEEAALVGDRVNAICNSLGIPLPAVTP